MTTNTERPIAPSGFTPNLRVIPGTNGGGDVAEYITPEASGLESGFYTEDRGLPWHVTLARRLDTPELMTASGRKLTSGEARVLAGLDWEVGMAPMSALIDGAYIDVPGKFATYRKDTNAILGSGRSQTFRVFQNEEAFEFGDLLVEAGADWETAGSLYGGRQVFMAMEVPNHIHVDGDPSEYRLFLVVSNGHDGKHLFRADVTIERVTCRNTLRISHARAISSWAIRHRPSLEGRVAEARQALGLTFAVAETFAESASALVSKTLVDRQVDAILAAVFPLTETQQERVNEDPSKRDALPVGIVRRIYDESPTVEPVRGTAYGVLNAVSEYIDHFKAYTNDDRKADHILFDEQDAKQRAWSLLEKV